MIEIIPALMRPDERQALLGAYSLLERKPNGDVYWETFPDPIKRVIGLHACRFWPREAFVETILMARLDKGQAMTLHADNHDLMGKPNHTPDRELSSITYLTDCEGGELVFPDLGVSVSPKPGMVIVFDSAYAHLVTKVTDGPRYSLPIWFTRNPRRRLRNYP